MSDPSDEAGLSVPGWVWAVYAALFLASVPWYLPAGELMPVVFALPMWVVISLTSVVAIAAFTAFVIHRYWKESV